MKTTMMRLGYGNNENSINKSSAIFVMISVVLMLCFSASASSTVHHYNYDILHKLRGGSSPFRAGPATTRPITSDPFGLRRKSSSRTSTRYKQPKPQQQQQKQDEDSADTTASKAATKEMIDAFLTRDSRNTFIARVYAILSVQLIFTAGVCLLFGLYPPLTNISAINPATGQYTNSLVMIPLGGIFLSTIAWFRMAASPQARQKSPNKWWWMSIFTLGEAMSLGCLSSLYKLSSVISAMGATAIATIAVSAYTIMQNNSKYDLSRWGATLSSWAMILLVYMVIGLAQQLKWIPFQIIPYTDMASSIFGACLFSLFLAHHTKLIVGGKHAKYRMNEKVR
jgi:FtsH-binding integral membrane protein